MLSRATNLRTLTLSGIFVGQEMVRALATLTSSHLHTIILIGDILQPHSATSDMDILQSFLLDDTVPIGRNKTILKYVDTRSYSDSADSEFASPWNNTGRQIKSSLPLLDAQGRLDVVWDEYDEYSPCFSDKIDDGSLIQT